MIDIVVIDLWCGTHVPTLTGGHVHPCPNCYRRMPCEMTCSIEPDLSYGGKLSGAHATCDECEPCASAVITTTTNRMTT